MSGADVVIECLGWTLVHFLWEGLVIAIVLRVLLRALQKASANSRYMAGCVALVLMIVAPVVTFMQLAKQPAPAPPAVFRTPIESVAVDTTPKVISIQPPKMVVPEQKKPAATLSWSERLSPLLPVLVAGWAMGVIVLALRLSTGWLRVKRLKSLGTEPMEEVWHARLAELARRLRINGSVRIVKSALVEVPTVIGWLRPIILMPAGCLAGLSAAQVEYILAHELAHVRRHDYLVNLLQCLAETILFYHPAVWWVSKRVREEREHCCDDVAVSVCGDRLEYARTLAALEELRGSQNQLVMAAAGAPLLQRIRRLAGQSERNPSHPVWPLAAIIILVLVAAMGLGLRNSRAIADQVQENKLAAGHMLSSDTRTNVSKNIVKTVAQIDKPSGETALPQIDIHSKFLEVDEKDFPKAIFNLPAESNAVCLIATPLQTLSNSIGERFIGMLTESQYKAAVKQLEMASNIDSLTAPSVTTESGRQAQIQAVDIIELLTNASPGVAKCPCPIGPVLDVLPTVTQDKLGVQLRTIASVTKLLDAPTVLLPRIQLTQLTNDMIVNDGQTLVMGGLMSETITKVTDRVPGLASIPLAGRLFRSESVSKSRKYLIVFVTPTLINADGSRYHSDKKKPGKVSSAVKPGALTNQTVITLVQDGKLLFESGKSDVAEAKFQEALKLDLNNAAASYYLGLIREKRNHAGENRGELQLVHPMLKWDAQATNTPLSSIPALSTDISLHPPEVDNSYVYDFNWHEPTNGAKTNVLKTGRGRQGILATLAHTQANPADYNGLTLRDAVAKLKQATKSSDSTQGEIAFLIQQPSQTQSPQGVIDPSTGLPFDLATIVLKVAQTGTNVSMAVVLDCIATNNSLQYAIGDHAVVFSLKGPETIPLFTRVYHIDPITFRHGLEAVGAISKDSTDSQGGGQKDGSRNVARTNSYEDIQIAARNLFIAAGAEFNPANPANVGKSLFFNERKGILMVHATTEDLDIIEKVMGIINTPGGQNELDGPPKHEEEQNLRNSIAKTNLVKTIKGRKEIIAALNRVQASPADYDGLTLQEATVKLSQTIKLGNSNRGGVNFFIERSARAQLPAQEKGDPTSNPPPYLARQNDDLGTKVLKLPQQRVGVPLTAVLDCIVTNNSLQYAVEDYAVVFSVKKSEPAPMYTRVYHLSTNRINSAFKQLASASSNSNSSSSTNADLPIDFRAFFNAAGVDFSPTNPANTGKSIYYKDRKGMLMVHATTQDLDRIEKALERINITAYIQIKTCFVEMDETAGAKIKFGEIIGGHEVKTNSSVARITPPQSMAHVAIPKVSLSGSFPLVTNALEFQFTGVLTPEQYKEAITQLKQANGVDILTMPDVTTESGREAQIQAVDIRSIVTGLTTVYTNGTTSNMYSTQTLPFGPVLDIIPTVSANNTFIEMTLVPTVMEFLGYDDPKKMPGEKRTDVQIPLPHFRLRQMTSTVSVKDGQTVVLGGIEQTDSGKRGKEKKGKRKTLLIFVTPTLINADGTPNHAKTEQQAALKETK